MLRLEMLPADNGDCLWIEWGSAEAVHRVLIDAGTARSYEALRNRILALPRAERVFELLVITHVDNDHIEGVIPLLQDAGLGCVFRDVWYNGWPQIERIDEAPVPGDVLGAREGEFLGVLLEDQHLPWNVAFGGGPVVLPEDGPLPTFDLAGLQLTLLSPSRQRLADLRDRWIEVAEDALFTPGDVEAMRRQLAERRYLKVAADVLGVEDGPSGRDNSAANASSIGLLAEYEGTRLLLTGDAVPDVLVASLHRLGARPDARLQVAAFKLPHHGSWQNVTEELLLLVRSPRYLISTNGRGHGHPHRRALELVEQCHGRGRPEFVFNHRSATTAPWADPTPAATFRSTFPGGTVLVLPTAAE